MRPTYLKFRNPKEQTGEFLYPLVTSTGMAVTAYSFYPANKGTFSKGKRWEHIEEVSRRTGFTIGPGSYNFKISTNKGTSALMRPDSAVSSNVNKEVDYIYVGHVLAKRDKSHQRSKSQPRFTTQGSLCSTRVGSDFDWENSPFGNQRNRPRNQGNQGGSLRNRSASRENERVIPKLGFGANGSLTSRMTNEDDIGNLYLKSQVPTTRVIRVKKSVTGRLTDRPNLLEDNFSKTQIAPKGISPKSKYEVDQIIKRVVPNKVSL